LFYRLGNGSISNQQLKDFIAQRNNKIYNFFKTKMRRSGVNQLEASKQEVTSNYDLLVFGKDDDKLDYKLSACCNPIPGDKVFGFVTVSDGIKVHKQNCPNALSMQSQFAYRVIQAKWIDSSQQEYKVILKVTGIDNMGLVNEVTRIISSNMNVNIHSLNIAGDNGIFEGNITVSIKNNAQLNKLTAQIKNIDGIEKIERVNK
jgi:GTP pyrophosphokinase